MIAIPDFGAGAMENWGLITYRETALLFKPGVSAVSNKQRIATVVSHELAHQWFGMYLKKMVFSFNFKLFWREFGDSFLVDGFVVEWGICQLRGIHRCGSCSTEAQTPWAVRRARDPKRVQDRRLGIISSHLYPGQTSRWNQWDFRQNFLCKGCFNYQNDGQVFDWRNVQRWT